MKKAAFVLAGLSAMVIMAPAALAHCQIPCGIYDDEMRFAMLEEHITTIEKSIKEITRLSAEEEKNYNQIVRWVNNKDYHADEFADIVTYYFLAQRVKPVEDKGSEAYPDYSRKITLLHEMLVYAMKAKQTVELAHVEKLRSLSADFRAAYLGPEAGEEHKH